MPHITINPRAPPRRKTNNVFTVDEVDEEKAVHNNTDEHLYEYYHTENSNKFNHATTANTSHIT